MHNTMQAHLICAIIAGDFLTKYEDFLVTKHLFLHGCIERLTNRHLKGKSGKAMHAQSAYGESTNGVAPRFRGI